jgi:hypothetical protein
MVFAAGERASFRFIEFFTANIRNPKVAGALDDFDRNDLALLGSPRVVVQRRFGDPALKLEFRPRSRSRVEVRHDLRHFRRR